MANIFRWPFRRQSDAGPAPLSSASSTADATPASLASAGPRPSAGPAAPPPLDPAFAASFRAHSATREATPLLGPWGGLADTARFAVSASNFQGGMVTQRWSDDVAERSAALAHADTSADFARSLPSLASYRDPFASPSEDGGIFAATLPVGSSPSFAAGPAAAAPAVTVARAPASPRPSTISRQPASPSSATQAGRRPGALAGRPGSAASQSTPPIARSAAGSTPIAGAVLRQPAVRLRGTVTEAASSDATSIAGPAGAAGPAVPHPAEALASATESVPPLAPPGVVEPGSIVSRSPEPAAAELPLADATPVPAAATAAATTAPTTSASAPAANPVRREPATASPASPSAPVSPAASAPDASPAAQPPADGAAEAPLATAGASAPIPQPAQPIPPASLADRPPVPPDQLPLARSVATDGGPVAAKASPSSSPQPTTPGATAPATPLSQPPASELLVEPTGAAVTPPLPVESVPSPAMPGAIGARPSLSADGLPVVAPLPGTAAASGSSGAAAAGDGPTVRRVPDQGSSSPATPPAPGPLTRRFSVGAPVETHLPFANPPRAGQGRGSQSTEAAPVRRATIITPTAPGTPQGASAAREPNANPDLAGASTDAPLGVTPRRGEPPPATDAQRASMPLIAGSPGQVARRPADDVGTTAGSAGDVSSAGALFAAPAAPPIVMDAGGPLAQAVAASQSSPAGAQLQRAPAAVAGSSPGSPSPAAELLPLQPVVLPGSSAAVASAAAQPARPGVSATSPASAGAAAVGPLVARSVAGATVLQRAEEEVASESAPGEAAEATGTIGPAQAPPAAEQDIDKLTEKVWQRIRRMLQLERERRRGLP